MSVSISEIIAGASTHAVPLAGECAGYLVLAAADQTVAAPRRIGPGEVHLEGDGRVRVEGARAAAEADSEADLRALLDALLLRASSTTPALLRASRRPAGRGIAALVREIETALIPVNRAAAHRALARLERETERARHAGRIDVTSLAPVPSEPVRAPVVAAPPAAPPSSVPPAVEPKAGSGVLSPVVEEEHEIPSLFAPPVEAIAAYAAEIETRPEPIVVRRSAPPPPSPRKTPSPPPLPVHRSSPPPLAVASHSSLPPVVEAQRTTPVFGTLVASNTPDDDEVDIEVVFDEELIDDELADDELTGVLVRSAPLEVSAMHEIASWPEPTEPCPLVLEDEPLEGEPAESDAVLGEADAAAESDAAEREGTELIAEAAEMPPAEAVEMPVEAAELPPPVEAAPDEVVEMPPVEAAPVEAVEMPPVEAAEMPPVEAAEMPPVEAAPDEVVEMPPAEAAPVEVAEMPPAEAAGAFAWLPEIPPDELPRAQVEPVEVSPIDAADHAPSEGESVEVLLADAPSLEAEPVEAISAEPLWPVTLVPPPVAVVSFEAPSEPVLDEPFDGHGETMALALAIEPVLDALPPPERLPLPKPRQSDVEDLLERMLEVEDVENDELRANLKGIAGLDPTPPPAAADRQSQ